MENDWPTYQKGYSADCQWCIINSATVNDVSCNDVSYIVQTVNDSFFGFGNPKVTVHKAKGHIT